MPLICEENGRTFECQYEQVDWQTGRVVTGFGIGRTSGLLRMFSKDVMILSRQQNIGSIRMFDP